jgi:hypothetical protein
MSRAPDLEQHVDQNQRQTGPNRQNYFLTIVSDDGDIILDIRIAIKKLVSPSPDKEPGKQKNDYCESECSAQRGNASLFNNRYQQGNIRFHRKSLSMLAIGCCEASVGFFLATEEGISTPSSEINAASSALVTFGGEDRFRIGAGNFADRDPANAADQRAD